MTRLVWLGWVAVAVCCLVLAADRAMAQGGADTVQFKKGLPQWVGGVTITKETYKAIEVAGKEPRHPSEIETIKHGDAPADYFAAEQSLRQGLYERAIQKFEEASKANARPWLKHYCQYYAAVSKQRMAEGDDLLAVASEYEKVIKDTPNGIKVPDAKYGVAQCYYLAGQLDKAAAVAAEIAKSDYGEAWQLKGRIDYGKILLDQGKGAEAVKVFEEIHKTAKGKGAMVDTYFQAAVHRGAALVLAGQTAEAITLLTKTFEETESEEVKAAVHNTMGDAYRSERKIREARDEYLRVVVLYADVPEEHARALFYAADCFVQLKEPENARKMQNLLVQKHPDSVWRKRLSG